MLDFASAKSRSEATDSRSMATDKGVAAGSNRGIVQGMKTYNVNSSSKGWKIAAVAGFALFAWQIPAVRNRIKKLLRIKP